MYEPRLGVVRTLNRWAVTEVTMYNLLAILIVVVAIAYIIRTFYKRLKKQDPGCCGCSSCNTDSTYCDPTKD